MKDPVLISVCIPAYKNTTFLKRLLDSISIQTFRDFEVIITDDSPDDTVHDFIAQYESDIPIKYFRNPVALGTPENWNEAIRQAKGKWIKIMHDDDWFSDAGSLSIFADSINKSSCDFIYSAYTNVFINTGVEKIVYPSKFRQRKMKKEPYTLFAKNIIGPPSVTIHKNYRSLNYDNKTKWVVDIDFYIRMMAKTHVAYIDRPLINVGMSEQQVTMDCVNNRKVQVPENFYLLGKVGYSKLKNLMIYDAWWRLIRNLEITDLNHIRDAGYSGFIPSPIQAMVTTQKNIPRKLLTIGLYSKICMFVHYCFHANKTGN